MANFAVASWASNVASLGKSAAVEAASSALTKTPTLPKPNTLVSCSACSMLTCLVLVAVSVLPLKKPFTANVGALTGEAALSNANASSTETLPETKTLPTFRPAFDRDTAVAADKLPSLMTTPVSLMSSACKSCCATAAVKDGVVVTPSVAVLSRKVVTALSNVKPKPFMAW